MGLLRVKELLAEKGISGKLLAEKIGVTPATVSNINNGNHFPKEELLVKISQVLECEVRDLFISKATNSGKSIFIEENGKYIKIGEIKPERLDEGSVAGSDE